MGFIAEAGSSSENSILKCAEFIACTCSLGKVDARPGYHTASQLWAPGFAAESLDEAAGKLVCTVQEDQADGPLFTISLELPLAGASLEV